MFRAERAICAASGSGSGSRSSAISSSIRPSASICTSLALREFQCGLNRPDDLYGSALRAAIPQTSFRQLSAQRQQFAAACGARFGISQFERLHGVEHDAGHDEAGAPLFVGRNPVPRGVLRAGRAQGFLVGLHIVLPEFALLDVREAEFPVLFRPIDAVDEPLALLFLGKVQEELYDPRAVAVQVPLQISDGTIALMPDGLLVAPLVGQAFGAEDLRMYPGDQHFLVIGTVENADPAALGQVARGAPEKVVLQFGGAGMLEAEYLAALRVDARHDMRDRTVFPCRVHGLKNQQDGIGVRSIEQLLLRAQALDVLAEQVLILPVRLVHGGRERRPF